MNQLQALLGLFAFTAVAWLLSENRSRISWKFVAIGLIMQFVVAFGLLKIPIFQIVLMSLNEVVMVISEVTTRATQFMFGYLAGGPTPFQTENPQASFIVAFQVLPLILVVSALSSLLFYWGILPLIIQLFAKVLMRIFGVSGALGFGAASTLFMGTIEAPLLIRPYLAKLSRSELLSLLSCTMATIAGTVMVLYASVVEGVVENAAGHFLVASMISIPAALLLSHIMCPSEGQQQEEIKIEKDSHSSLDALIKGTLDGLTMVLNIAAVIIVFFAIIYLVNTILEQIFPGQNLTLERMVGTLLQPVIWLIGIPWQETAVAGELMAVKIVLNEFVAYLQLSQLELGTLSSKSTLILTYALCGFANIGSMGIIIGGLGSILPQRREEIIQLTTRSLLIGNLATLMTAAVIAIMT